MTTWTRDTSSEESLKKMSDDQQSWPIFSANKIGQQKSVTRHAKINQSCQPMILSDFIVRLEHDKIGQLFGYRSADFVYVSTVIVYS